MKQLLPLVALVSFLAACAAVANPPSDKAPDDNGGAAPADGTTPAATTPGSPAATTPPGTTPPADTGGLSALQKHKAEMLTSIWENGTTVLQYGYAENIGDGRGYTSGRAGFCTGTGDAILVVKCLDAATASSNLLHKYMPALTDLETAFNDTGDDQADTDALDEVGNWVDDWGTTASDPATQAAFATCQDTVVADLYWTPALDEAKKWGLSTPLSLAALYDAEINHGDEGDDGVAALAAQANTDTGNGAQKSATAALAQDAESAWLEAFLARRFTLLNSDPTWQDALDRVAEYESLRGGGNFDMSAVITTNAKASTVFGGNYTDSDYPACIIAADGTVSGDADCTSANPGN